jgi:hypothetical protein
LKQPEQNTMAEMPEMERMPGPGQMMEMQQMTGMEQQEHPSNDMAAAPGEMKMTEMKPDGPKERR